MAHLHQPFASHQDSAEPEAHDCYRRALLTLREAHVPFLIGGAYAFERYTGLARHTKDFDLFLRPRDCDRALHALSSVGYHTDLTYPHWLGKAFCGESFIDLIFNSGNGVCRVDDEWFEYAIEDEVLGFLTLLCPPEEQIWSKAFIMERERYDGADIIHMLRACGAQLAWPRLVRRFDEYWRILLSYLLLFGFVYPTERGQIPEWVMQDLFYRLRNELHEAPPKERLCRGTLLSREQYIADTTRWGYQDARLIPHGMLTQEEVDHWTAAIDDNK